MKLQWMKDILGDAYTDEMDAKVSAALGERFVARADFNEKTGKVKELETQVTQLNEGIKTRDKQLEDLKKSAGDNEELTKQIETLTQQNKDAKANYDKELAKVKLMAAVDAELTAAGSKNNTAVLHCTTPAAPATLTSACLHLTPCRWGMPIPKRKVMHALHPVSARTMQTQRHTPLFCPAYQALTAASQRLS